MKSEMNRLLIALALGLGLSLALLWLLGGGSSARAAPAAELRVCPSGCTYLSIQAAVDDANDIVSNVAQISGGALTWSVVEALLRSLPRT